MAVATEIACPHCLRALPPEMLNTGAAEPCPWCRREILVEVFPAYYRPPEAIKTGELTLVEGEASCFYHAQKKAAVSCEGCGRFLCALCDVEFRGQHLCPACIEAGKKRKKSKHLENRRMLYDEMALAFAIVPVLIFYLTIITAPIAIFISIRHWNTPGSVVRSVRRRYYVVAILISSLQLLGWAIGAYFIFRAVRGGAS